MKLRVGVVGLGEAWEHRYRPALRAMADRYEVRAFCEQVRRRADLAAAEFSAAAVDGYRSLVAREDIDAVLLLSAQWFGVLPILAACDAGKSLYFGSGLDLDVDELRGVIRRVEASGVAFMAEFPRRCAPATLRLKELIATRLGPPRLLFCHRRLMLADQMNGFGRRPAVRGHMPQLVELVDWCRYVVGRGPAFVTGVLHRSDDASPPDYQMMSLDFSEPDSPGTGAVAQISCGRYIPPRWQEAIHYRPLADLQVSCERGIAFVDLPSTLIWFDEAGRHQESLEHDRSVGEQLLAQFHRAVTSLVRKTADMDDAYSALWIVEQARQSFLQGRRMALCGGRD